MYNVQVDDDRKTTKMPVAELQQPKKKNDATDICTLKKREMEPPAWSYRFYLQNRQDICKIECRKNTDGRMKK